MTQPKIAFIWSGQTRDMSTLPEEVEKTMRSHRLISQGFDVDHFGHTWSDQEDPYNSYQMKRWHKTDQQDIINWAMENYNRIMFHQDWTSEPEWHRLNKHQQFDRVLELQKPIWGQIWSFLEGLHALGPQNVKNYDYIIKTRYDTAYYDHANTPSYTEAGDRDEAFLCGEFNKKLHWLLNNYRYAPPSSAITSIDGFASTASGFIQDHVIVFRSSPQIKELASHPPGYILDQLIKRCQSDQYHSGLARHYWESMTHSLWYQFIVKNEMYVTFHLPSIFSRNSSNTMKVKDYTIGGDQ